MKPSKLIKGDTVATVSLSWGGAGDEDLLWRYNVGKQRLEQQFGLKVIEMENTLKGSEYLYNHPEKRAQDLMDAFSDPDVKAIFSCIGGEESIRMLPYIDFDAIRNNPKIFIGYSDSTTTHLICLKAGLSSFYGPSVLAELAENIKIFDYTAEWMQKVLFDNSPIGEIKPAVKWTGKRIEWLEKNASMQKTMYENQGYEFWQGSGKVTGHLIGGCIEVLEMAKETPLWPDDENFDDAVLFFETSEDMPEPKYIEWWLRSYGSMRILQRAKALLFGKPYQGRYYDEYKDSIMKIISELQLFDLPVVYNMSFGHNEPMCILPYGALAEVDCENQTFTILESGVI
ncbi:MAG TPA: LD-carboxypeptidase [Clostridiales bacterium]|nr:LD-carboxypeptidase [Clostridiales bacterium]